MLSLCSTIMRRVRVCVQPKWSVSSSTDWWTPDNNGFDYRFSICRAKSLCWSRCWIWSCSFWHVFFLHFIYFFMLFKEETVNPESTVQSDAQKVKNGLKQPWKHRHHSGAFYSLTKKRVSAFPRQTVFPSQDSKDPLWAERKARSRQIWSVTRGELRSSGVSPHMWGDTRGINEKMAKRVKFKLNTRCRVQTPRELQRQDAWRARPQCKSNLCVSMLISAGRPSNARHISLSLCFLMAVDQSLPFFISITVSLLFLLVTRLVRLSPPFTLSVKDEGHIWQLADGWRSVI